MDLALHHEDGVRQAASLLGVGLEKVIGDTLGALGTDARKAAQLIEKDL